MTDLDQIALDVINGWESSKEEYPQYSRSKAILQLLIKSAIEESISNIKSEWISVKDRLPEFSIKVLLYWRPIDHEKRPFHREIIVGEHTPYGPEPDCQYDLSGGKYVWANSQTYEIETFITHWMPLPEPPEDSDGD